LPHFYLSWHSVHLLIVSAAARESAAFYQALLYR